MNCNISYNKIFENQIIRDSEISIIFSFFLSFYIFGSGGAIFSFRNHLKIVDCFFKNCSSTNYGGAIDHNGFSLIIEKTIGEKCTSNFIGQFGSFRGSENSPINIILSHITECSNNIKGLYHSIALYTFRVFITQLNSTFNYVQNTVSSINLDKCNDITIKFYSSFKNFVDDILLLSFWDCNNLNLLKSLFINNTQKDNRLGLINVIDNSILQISSSLFIYNSKPLFSSYDGKIIISNDCIFDYFTFIHSIPIYSKLLNISDSNASFQTFFLCKRSINSNFTKNLSLNFIKIIDPSNNFLEEIKPTNNLIISQEKTNLSTNFKKISSKIKKVLETQN